MKLASRSAIPSANSANTGSSASIGDVPVAPCVGVCAERREFRDGGRNGVVGRGGGVCERVLDEERLCVSS